MEVGYFAYLSSLQSISHVPETWIGCFPSSLLEPETLEAVRHDKNLTDRGKKQYLEMGWFEMAPGKDWGPGVKDFLDKQEPKTVVYVR